jgi:hypothetical protein
MSAETDKPLIDIVKETMKERKMNPRHLSKATGIPADRIYKWMQRGLNPKAEDAEKLKAWISSKDDVVNVPRGKHASNYTEQALMNLTESNRLMAKSNADLAESHKELVQMVKGKFTADAPPQNEAALNVIRRAVVSFLIDVAAGKRWRSRDEAGSAYNKLVADMLQEETGGDIQTNLDKLYSGIQS